ncbi:MAG: DUF1702 family protein [Armatimonadetes bacterium]|nr:DUF1702 family protein [Armatimonadota bacterium]
MVAEKIAGQTKGLGLAALRLRLFGLSLDEATFVRRGFRPTVPEKQARLERVGQTFLTGYLTAIRTNDPALVEQDLRGIDGEFKGFAYEGAAMGLFLLDTVAPWRKDRWSSFARGAGEPHLYMAHVGAGWVLARLKRSFERSTRSMDPLLRWLTLDGYGFHEAYFKPDQTVAYGKRPNMNGYAPRAFDQGVGRAVWFVSGGNCQRACDAIENLETERRADLYAGLGLATTYAGGADEEELGYIADRCGIYLADVRQGSAFAAKARQRAGFVPDHTELACQVYAKMSADEAAKATDDALIDLPTGDYEEWRTRVRKALS